MMNWRREKLTNEPFMYQFNGKVSQVKENTNKRGLIKNLPSPPRNRLLNIKVGDTKIEDAQEWTKEWITTWTIEWNAWTITVSVWFRFINYSRDNIQTWSQRLKSIKLFYVRDQKLRWLLIMTIPILITIRTNTHLMVILNCL